MKKIILSVLLITVGFFQTANAELKKPDEKTTPYQVIPSVSSFDVASGEAGQFKDEVYRINGSVAFVGFPNLTTRIYQFKNFDLKFGKSTYFAGDKDYFFNFNTTQVYGCKGDSGVDVNMKIFSWAAYNKDKKSKPVSEQNITLIQREDHCW